MKKVVALSLTTLLLLVLGCATGKKIVVPEMTKATAELLAQKALRYPQTRFVVFSDPHLYDPELGIEGAAFEQHLSEDRKMLVQGPEILQSAIEGIAAQKPDFVLVCGDLTTDGERSSHQLFAGYLAGLEASGIEVYVIPGNHDIANDHALRYFGEKKKPVETVSAEEFRRLYGDFGFTQAVISDRESLSYVVEPVPGLWVLALDSCRYREQGARGEPITDGMFSSATLEWLGEVLERSVRDGKALLALMHHGLMEHHDGHEKHDGEYLVDGFEQISRFLAEYRVRMVLTGHDHAQDITIKRWPDGLFLYDVETGSLATYPCPYRVVSIKPDQGCEISSHFIDSIKSHPVGFSEFARSFVLERIETIAVSRMVDGYKVSEKDARLIAPQVAAAYVAHYRGDEKPEGEIISKEGVGWWGRIIVSAQKEVITGRWHDYEPADNDIVIDLATGRWQ